MFNRSGLWLPASAISLIVLVVVLGCGGGGTAGTTTGGNATTTGSSTTTSSGGTAGTMSLTPAATPANITEKSLGMGLVLNYKGTPGATFVWSVQGPIQGPNGVLIFDSPGSQGTLQTVGGQPFPTGATTLTQAVYFGNPAQFTFGGYDRVFVQSELGTSTFGPNTFTTIGLSNDFSTLPNPITSAVGSVSVDRTTYKPGDTVTATIHVIPSLNNGAMTIETPLGFNISNSTINGVATSLPATYHYGPFDPAFTLTVTFVILPTTPNEFPVSGATSGQTGPWMIMDSSAWTIKTPFFVHA